MSHILVYGLEIPLNPIHILCSALEFTNAVVSIFLGFFVFFHNPKDTLKRLFLAFALSISFISLTGPIVYTLAFNNRINDVLSSSSSLVQMTVSPLLLNLSLLFPEKKKNSPFAFLIYLPLLLIVVLFFGLDGLGNIRAVDGMLIYEPQVIFIYMLYTGAYFIVLVVILVNKLIKTKNETNKKQLFYMLLGLILGCFINVVFALLRLVFKLSISRIGTELSSFSFIFFIFYSIIKYQAYDIKTAIHYSIYRVLSELVIISPIVIMPFLLFGGQSRDNMILLFPLYGVCSIVYFASVRKLLLPFVDRITMKRKYRLAEELDILFEQLDVSITPEDMERKIYQSIRSNIHSEDIAVLFREKKSRSFEGRMISSSLRIRLDKYASGVIEECEPVITKRYITETGGALGILVERNVELAVRIVSNNEDVGLLCLCAKKNLEPFYYEEIEFVKKVAKRIALLMEKNYIEKLGALKTEYFIAIAHELKTPLTIIENILDKEISNRGSTDELDVIGKYFDKMKNDIVNLLDIEKLENSEIFYNHDSIVDLSGILELKTKLFEEIARIKGISILPRIKKKVYVKIDPYAMDRVVNNIVENAIKYNRENGSVAISLRATEGEAFFSVGNTGPGIPDEYKTHIFEPYYQIPRERRNSGGIGIGLSIVKKIVDQLGARITVSDYPGGGASFEIAFTRHALAKGESPVADLRFSRPGREVAIKTEDVYVEGKPSILIVEDNIDQYYMLKIYLKDDYNLYYAADGKAALDKLKTISAPHLIITDIVMNTMDGFELQEELNRQECYEKIPLLFITAKTTIADRKRAIAGGAIDFISKPFPMDELVLKVKSIIDNVRIREKANIKEFGSKVMKFIAADVDENRKWEIIGARLSSWDITGKELAIIRLISKGHPNKAIAAARRIGTHSVRNSIAKIFAKLGVHGRYELIDFINNLI